MESANGRRRRIRVSLVLLAGGAAVAALVGAQTAANGPTEPRKRPAYRLLNARLGFSNGATELALVGKNLTNEVTNLADNRSIAAEVPGRPRLFLNQPRTIGIEVTQRF